jgi:predicted translin family RNA/ssDNA-binding protein
MDADFFILLQKGYRVASDARKQAIGVALKAQALAKRAIFAMHREDVVEAERLLGECRGMMMGLVREKELRYEGSVVAMVEEYLEAEMYVGYVKTGEFVVPEGFAEDAEAVIGAICDVTGELQRRQVMLAVAGDAQGVRKITGVIRDMVAQLMAMDLEGVLRTKGDQAKHSLRRAEDVEYDMVVKSRRE